MIRFIREAQLGGKKIQATIPLNIFLLNMNFDKFTIKYIFFLYFSYLQNL